MINLGMEKHFTVLAFACRNRLEKNSFKITTTQTRINNLCCTDNWLPNLVASCDHHLLGQEDFFWRNFNAQIPSSHHYPICLLCMSGTKHLLFNFLLTALVPINMYFRIFISLVSSTRLEELSMFDS
mgnify:CR=1 FL=1